MIWGSNERKLELLTLYIEESTTTRQSDDLGEDTPFWWYDFDLLSKEQLATILMLKNLCEPANFKGVTCHRKVLIHLCDVRGGSIKIPIVACCQECLARDDCLSPQSSTQQASNTRHYQEH